MSDYNVKIEEGKVISVDENELGALFSEKYPMWACKGIATAIINDDEADITSPINFNIEKDLYKIIDLDEAAKESGIGAFDVEDYGDEEYPLSSWIEDVEMNLKAHVATNGKLRDTEFLVKNI
ncbi:MAG: hypothetical protein J6N72_05965 [Psychrobacter sp.]|nr:hypothetical protein [Psychrobacter sp.]